MREACKPTRICLYVAYLNIHPHHFLLCEMTAASEDVTQLYHALWWLQDRGRL